jgi:glycosyltransferase involved in cell wall biosynthesis
MPPDPRTGSGCAVATANLVKGVEALDVAVKVLRPRFLFPVFTAKRILFNESLRLRDLEEFDATIGIDLDGYALPCSHTPHIANIKGVLGDAVRFESGWTRGSMALQARLEARHVHRANRVVTISQYCADNIRRRYKYPGPIGVVPEAIDLTTWEHLLSEGEARPRSDRFVVLCVCRHYRRKQVDVLLRAAARARSQAPDLLIRVVGDGPQRVAWKRLWLELRLEPIVEWVGPVSLGKLAREYASAHAFCLPSAQEGFGLVFLEAMAAGLPVIAANAAAIPEVVPHGFLCRPGCVEEFAAAILRLHDDSELRRQSAKRSRKRVSSYDIPAVAEGYLRQIELC